MEFRNTNADKGKIHDVSSSVSLLQLNDSLLLLIQKCLLSRCYI